ncbi:MAG: hypothetical protein HYX92_01270 [Chloroflexi bacterium]|nr:hypothetical protein [Chloroflexota bacterium]
MVGNPSGMKNDILKADIIYTHDPENGYTRYVGSANLPLGQGAFVSSASGGIVTLPHRSRAHAGKSRYGADSAPCGRRLGVCQARNKLYTDTAVGRGYWINLSSSGTLAP